MSGSKGQPRRLPLDGVVVPGALLLIARQVAFFTPIDELAWQLFHDTRVARRSAWLGVLRPQPSGAVDADPVSLLLAALASALALAYLLAAWRGSRLRWRAALLAVAVVLLVALPTAAVIGLGQAMRVPYGHDGAVVQLPLAMDKVLAGESPWGADYSRSVLGRQSRSSEFWAPFGGNPIIRHHWYLPGVHVLMIPPYLLIRAVLGFYDPRMVTLLAFVLAGWLASRLVDEPVRRVTAVAVVWLHPLIWWPQIFGVNDVFCALPLFLAFGAARAGRTRAAAAWLGLACAVKQLAWPFAPFLLVLLSGANSYRELFSTGGLRRLLAVSAQAGGVFLVVVVPLVAALDPAAFLQDVVLHQVGLPGTEQYPLGGTPGFGLANFVIYFGGVSHLGDPFPFSRFYVLLPPLGLWLLSLQFRQPRVSTVMINGSVALLASLYLSRIVNPNYLILAVLFLPLALLMDRKRPADLAVVPILLLALGLEYGQQELMRTTWQQAEALGHVPGLVEGLEPRPGPRWRDPLSLGLAALGAGAGLAYLLVALAGASRRLRVGLAAVAAVLMVGLPAWIVQRTGDEARVVRVQDPWWQDVRGPQPLERIDGRLVAPPEVRQAWPTSFRKLGEQPVPRGQPVSPGRWTLGRLLAILGGIDPRWIVWLSLAAAAILGARLVRPELRPALLGLALLSPLAGVGGVFGAGTALTLALLLAGAWAIRGGHAAAGGFALGCAAGMSWWAVWAAVPLGLAGDPGRRRAALAGATLGLATLWLPALLLGPGIMRGFAGAVPQEASVGLGNVLAYWGLEGGGLVGWVWWGLPAVLGAVALLWFRRGAAGFAPAAAGSLAALWLTPIATGHDLLAPALLALLAAGESPTSESPGA